MKYTNYIKPMLAKVAKKPFSDPDWLFEIKWDGYRAIAHLNENPVRLYSRNGISFARKYAPVYEALKRIKEKAIIDGEIVVINEKGLPDFQKLQDYEMNHQYPIYYYVFDLLYYHGKKIMDKPLLERKSLLKKMLGTNDIIRYCDDVKEAGENFFKVISDKEMEGVMAKRELGTYHAGRRSEDWLKIRNNQEEEAIIAGFTQPRGNRQYFGALILGVYDKKEELQYVGHTGTGFTEKKLEELYKKMKRLTRMKSPFNREVPVNNTATWLKPELVCNIKFTEWTKDGAMRHPVFLGLRIDKNAEEVRR